MKFLILISLFLASFNVLAVSVTVEPFDIELYTIENSINVNAELTLSCRYEKMVWSDSSEYYVEYKKVDLDIKNIGLRNGLIKHKISLKKKQYLKITGMFRPGKECKSEIILDLDDANYSVGWANQFSRPISFRFWNFKNYNRSDSIFTPITLRNQVENKVFSLKYTPVPSQVNITLLEDGEKISNLFIETSAKDKKTNMPYRLR